MAVAPPPDLTADSIGKSISIEVVLTLKDKVDSVHEVQSALESFRLAFEVATEATNLRISQDALEASHEVFPELGFALPGSIGKGVTVPVDGEYRGYNLHDPIALAVTSRIYGRRFAEQESGLVVLPEELIANEDINEMDYFGRSILREGTSITPPSIRIQRIERRNPLSIVMAVAAAGGTVIFTFGALVVAIGGITILTSTLHDRQQAAAQANRMNEELLKLIEGKPSNHSTEELEKLAEIVRKNGDYQLSTNKKAFEQIVQIFSGMRNCLWGKGLNNVEDVDVEIKEDRSPEEDE